jgi:hypothetical protein
VTGHRTSCNGFVAASGIKVYEQKCPEWRIVQELKRTVKELAQISATE